MVPAGCCSSVNARCVANNRIYAATARRTRQHLVNSQLFTNSCCCSYRYQRTWYFVPILVRVTFADRTYLTSRQYCRRQCTQLSIPVTYVQQYQQVGRNSDVRQAILPGILISVLKVFLYFVVVGEKVELKFINCHFSTAPVRT